MFCLSHLFLIAKKSKTTKKVRFWLFEEPPPRIRQDKPMKGILKKRSVYY